MSDNQVDWMKQVERRLSALETRTAVDEVHRVSVERRLGGIEDSLRWIMRLVIGGLVLGALTFALKGGMVLA